MIVDARDLPSKSTLECDVCIIGGGPAGISLALELAPTKVRVCILEAGGLEYERSAQSLLGGEVIGAPYPALRDTRLARFGGGTEVWAGWCRPLEPVDFEAREWVPNSGWPVTYDSMLPFYRRAHELCGLGDFVYDASFWEARTGARRLPLPERDFPATVFQASPVHFGSTHLHSLSRNAQIKVLLHAAASRLVQSPESARIESVAAGSLNGNHLHVTARWFVLAAGGIENARLLLASPDPTGLAIGNRHDQVGRYFTEHGFVEAGNFVATDTSYLPALHLFSETRDARRHCKVRCAFSPQRELAQRERLLGAALFLQPRYESHAVFDTAEVKAILQLWDKRRGRAVPGNVIHQLRRAMQSPVKVATALARRLLVKEGPQSRRRMHAIFECLPDRDNRVTLDVKLDALGRPRPRVYWRMGKSELRSIHRVHELFDQALQRAGLGRVETTLDGIESWSAATEGGKHHMGTTRMHVDPRQGVVDADARVHGTHNLYVAGSSVFPTTGFANPTLTIVALAIRLAEHLRLQVAELCEIDQIR